MPHISDQDFLEKLIIKSMLEDVNFGALVINTFSPLYFEIPAASDIFSRAREFFITEKKLPETGFLMAMVNSKESVTEFLQEAQSIEINTTKNLDTILSETDAFLKKAAVKRAILDSADVVNSDGDYGLIDKSVKEALAKSLKFEVGTNYWDTLGERLQRIFTDVKRLIPSYFPTLDELISGGFPPKTLSVFAAATHGGKCVSGSTYITIRSKNTIKQVTISSVVNKELEISYKNSEISMDKKKALFIKKYGIEQGSKKWSNYLELQKSAKYPQ